MPKDSVDTQLEQTATTLMRVVEKTFNGMSEKGIKDDSKMKKKAIIEYEGQMRISGMDIFNESTYISAISYYASEEDKTKHKAVGAIILYMPKEHAELIFKQIGWRDFDDEDVESMMETLGKLGNIIAENFNKELPGSYVMSEPENYFNSVPLGVDFSKDQFDQYELSFFNKDKGFQILAIDVTMA